MKGGPTIAMRRLLSFAVLSSIFLIGLVASAADLPTTSIPWSAGYAICWNDFQCSPPADAERRVDVAAIHMTIQWQATYEVRSQYPRPGWMGTVKQLSVTNVMDPSRSWVLASRANPNALRHEQFHFNLNEVYRSKLESALSRISVQDTSSDAAQAALNDLLQRTAGAVLDQLANMQARYDAETGHGTDAAGQASWEAMIVGWLQSPSSAP